MTKIKKHSFMQEALDLLIGTTILRFFSENPLICLPNILLAGNNKSET